MKRVVRNDQMTWLIVLLVATVVAERAGPGIATVYYTALGVAAVALIFVVAPGWIPGRTDRGHDARNERRAR